MCSVVPQMIYKHHFKPKRGRESFCLRHCTRELSGNLLSFCTSQLGLLYAVVTCVLDAWYLGKVVRTWPRGQPAFSCSGCRLKESDTTYNEGEGMLMVHIPVLNTPEKVTSGGLLEHPNLTDFELVFLIVSPPPSPQLIQKSYNWPVEMPFGQEHISSQRHFLKPFCCNNHLVRCSVMNRNNRDVLKSQPIRGKMSYVCLGFVQINPIIVRYP